MANQIQVTVVNVSGVNQPTALPFSFLTSTIVVYNQGINGSTSNARIDFYLNKSNFQSYYVTQSIDEILSAANEGTTSMVRVTAYMINNSKQSSPISVCLPSNAIAIQSVNQYPVNSIVYFNGSTFGVSETESEIVTAANVYNGGGGGSYWNVTGTTTLTGNSDIDVSGLDLNFNLAAGQAFFNADDGAGATTVSRFTPSYVDFTSSDGTNTAVLQNAAEGVTISQDDGVNSAYVFMTTHGLEYVDDYSSDFNSLTLINKGYADSAKYNVQTGTSYSLQDSDNGKVVTLNNGSAITLTVPAGLSAGFNCSIVQLGAGQVTITPSSTTVHNRQSYTKLAGQYAMATLLMYDTDIFVSQGDMTT